MDKLGLIITLVIILFAMAVVYGLLVALGEHLLNHGKDVKMRRIGWHLLHFIDCLTHHDDEAIVREALDKRFVMQYGERP